jgi:hypothetical protein
LSFEIPGSQISNFKSQTVSDNRFRSESHKRCPASVCGDERAGRQRSISLSLLVKIDLRHDNPSTEPKNQAPGVLFGFRSVFGYVECRRKMFRTSLMQYPKSKGLA